MGGGCWKAVVFVIWVVANSCVTGLANSPYNTASLKHAIQGRTSNSSSTTSELISATVVVIARRKI